MKKIICLIFAISISLCGFSQQVYQKVYYNYVMSGQIKSDAFLFDGYYSYHIVGFMPKNTYFELVPIGEIPIFNRNGIRVGTFHEQHRWLFYNRSRQRELKQPPRHHPKHKPIPPKPQPNKHRR